MRFFTLVSLAFPLALAAACDTNSPVGTTAAAYDVQGTDTPPGEGVATADGALPASLTCVSEPTRDGSLPEVLRVEIAVDGDAGTVTMQRGPQFWSHLGEWSDENGEPDVHLVRVAGGHLVDGEGVDIALLRDGAFLRGTLTDDHCYWRVETELTCWNEVEVFGSPWSGEAGALSAQFDWETGACLGADGEPALNDLPVEFVRETGYGQCADLRGAALNGRDFSYPDLSGWYLAGAHLDGATLFFAGIDNAALYGARLARIEFGHATIDGAIDEFTELPDGCQTTESAWAGSETVCRQ